MREDRDPNLQAGISRILARAKEHKRVVEEDQSTGGTEGVQGTGGTAGGQQPLSASDSAKATSGGSTGEASLPSEVSRTVGRIKERLSSGKEKVLEKLEAYKGKISFTLPGQSTVAVALWFIPMLFEESTADREVEDMIREKELEGSRFAPEMRRTSGLLSSLVRDDKIDVFDNEAAEKASRTLLGYFRALERVKRKSDWSQPKGPGGQKWKSKVQWHLFDRISWDKVEGSTRRYMPLEKEMSDDMQREALWNKYASRVSQDNDGVDVD